MTYPGYPPAPPAYPPQAPPAFPPQQPQPVYAPQPQYAPQYPMQQGYAPPQPVQQPLAQGTIDDFYNQPATGGGKSLALDVPGREYVGRVPRPIGPGDIQQQTQQGTNAPRFFKDGRPMFVMKVPLQMQPSAEYPDGLATWFVKGQARDELVRAMAEAGAPAGPPEADCWIRVTFTGTRPSGAGFQPTKLVAVHYTRPNGAPPVAPAVPQPQYQQPVQQLSYEQQYLPAYPPGMPPNPAAAQHAAPAPSAQPVQWQAPPPQPQMSLPEQGQMFVAQQFGPPPAQPQQAPPVAAPVVAGMTPEQQAVFAQLTQAGAAAPTQ